jgi:lysophospholipase L1-like esterase
MSGPAMGNPDSSNPPRRWQLPASGAALVLVLVVVQVWARISEDPDFDLPDPFRYVTAAGLLVLLLAGWMRSGGAKTLTVLVAGVAPVLLALGAECVTGVLDAGRGGNRFAVSADRLLRYTYRPGAGVPDAGRPGAPRAITSDGRWDHERPREKPPGTFRVVVLGDSVPNDPAIPFEDRFPKSLERSLNGAGGDGPRFEVLNVSCEGYNTLQEVRLLERVGLAYAPDVVVVAYVLNDPLLQSGGHRRIGNSYFLFRLAPLANLIRGGNRCSLFEPLHEGYSFDLAVRSPLERLKLLADARDFGVLVAALPIVEDFDDPSCMRMYDQVGAVAGEQGFEFVRVADAFAGREPGAFRKPGGRFDITHPNAEGHRVIAEALAGRVRAMLAR